MSDSNPIALPDPAADPQTYRDTLLAVATDHDPLETIAQTPARLRVLLAGHDPATLTRRPSLDEWSAADIIGHLLDDEIVNAIRLRLTLTADLPSYPGNDPERWVSLPKPPLDHLLTTFDSLRAYNLHLLRTLTPTDLSRTGLHAEQGPETVDVLIRKNAGHDLAHLDQLARCLGR
jgi:hypothetical protein